MRAMYGPQFQATYGDSPAENLVWLASIALLSDQDCREGFAKLAREPRKFPPNLTEFVDACRPRSAGVRFLGVPTTPNAAAALDVLPASPETAARHLAEIRKLFDKGETDDGR